MSRRLTIVWSLTAVLFLACWWPSAADAYGVLAHEATIDSAWDAAVVPLIRQRFPGQTADTLRRARAYAYGGSLIQDLGYFPFGSRLFTDLVHYVRTGDFVEALLREARTADEYAFALGALAHYASDNAGHPLAVNRAVPLMYPQLRAEFGDRALYVDNPKRHLMVEFAFDVSQVARGAYAAQAYHDFIGFQVARPLLERAFLETYGLEVKDLFMDVDLAIGTYRYVVSTTIPQMTRIAWRDRRDEIEKARPGITRDAFLFSMNRRTFDQDFGGKYRKPGPLSRVLAFFVKILPKVGPLATLAFEPLTPEVEQMFLDSAARAHERFRAALGRVGPDGSIELRNTDFDTGQQPKLGANKLADAAHAELSQKLAERKLPGATPALRHELAIFDPAVWPPEARRPDTVPARLQGTSR